MTKQIRKEASRIRSRSKMTVFFILPLVVAIGGMLMTVKKNHQFDPLREVKMPTMGGKQVWSDFYIRRGWRIQENTVTGHYRLLDASDVRHYWGSYEDCLSVLKDKAQTSGTDDSRPLIILIHGILRSGGAFVNLETALQQQGYETLSISYASTRRSLEQHGTALSHILENLAPDTKVGFVTHSMGALVLRQALEVDKPDHIHLTRAVLIAPPNQGAQLADRMQNTGAYKAVYGISGQQLTTDHVQELPKLTALEFGVLAGGRGTPEGFNPMLDGDDDGVVTVDETKLEGMQAFKILPALHSTILSKPETARAVQSFLKTGRFDPAIPENKSASQMKGDRS